MTDANNNIPELKLPGDAGNEAAAPMTTEDVAAAQAVQTQAAADMSAELKDAQKVVTPLQEDPMLSMDALSPDERKAVEDFSARIDIHDAQTVLGYGNDAQQMISSFSDKVLENVRTKDTGEVSGMLSSLVAELKGFDANEERKGFLAKLFNRAGGEVIALKARYDKVSVNVDGIVTSLQNHQKQLVSDIDMLDTMYDNNQQYFRQLTLYIIAGEEKLRKLREEELPPLIAKAKETGDASDAQAANDFAQLCERFEKKLHDLKLSRMVSVQMGPQVRLMQNNDTILAEKIQSTIVNTIPLWKSQMVIALGLAHSEQALKAEKAVTNMTNDLLKKNAEMLKQGTIETAKEAERGIIDVETIRIANTSLIETLVEVQRIQAEGSQKRQEASEELVRLEKELKDKLLEINQ